MNMMKNAIALAIMMAGSMCLSSVHAQSEGDAPFGFATMSSRTDASQTYDITGGGCYTYPVVGVADSKVKVLTAKNVTKDDDIKNAIKDYSVIIFDGSEGDITVNAVIKLSGLKDKTILGINNARLVTKWFLTAEDRAALDNANVKSASTSSGTGGTLPNGKSVSEQAEFLVRTILIEKYGNNEPYQQAGIFAFDGAQNVIIRNIKFVGPGSVDCGGYDLLGFTGCKNMWVDHCEFTDGIDGNFDITKSSDFCTVSWCTFSYTERAYMHMNTNLVGSDDSDGSGKLNITFAYNHWDKGCDQRMPMARNGKIHMLNNYYTCTSASATINARKNSEFLIEGNNFAGVKKVFSQKEAKAYVWVKDGDKANVIPTGVSAPSSAGTVTMPYSYEVVKASEVPTLLKDKVGTSLFGSTTALEGFVGVETMRAQQEAYNLNGQHVDADAKGFQIRNGKKSIVK